MQLLNLGYYWSKIRGLGIGVLAAEGTDTGSEALDVYQMIWKFTI